MGLTMSKSITEISSHPTAVVVPTPGEEVTSLSVEVAATSLAYRSKYADDRINEMVDAQMPDDWRRLSVPFVGSSLEEASYDAEHDVWLFGVRNDSVFVSLGTPHAVHERALTTSGGESGPPRTFVYKSGGLTLFTVDSNLAAPTNPDIWSFNGATFSRLGTEPLGATVSPAIDPLIFTGAYITDPGRFIYMGAYSVSGEPAAFTSDDDGATWAYREISAAGSEQVYSCVYDPNNNRVVAVGCDTSGSDCHAWVTSNGIDYTATALSGLSGVRFVAHSAEDSVFMLVSIASNVVTSYTSTDGVTWSQGGSVAIACTAVLGLACNSGRGGTDWRILAQTGDYGVVIFRSTNRGGAWSSFATIAQVGAAVPGSIGAEPFKHVGDRWVCTLTDGTDGELMISSRARVRPQATS